MSVLTYWAEQHETLAIVITSENYSVSWCIWRLKCLTSECKKETATVTE